MIDPHSLAKTLDAINESFFYDQQVSASQIEETAKWLCKRQYRTGPKVGLFAPTAVDYREGVRLFTGEKLNTKLATDNILSQETARALLLFELSSEEVQKAIVQANQRMFRSCYATEYCALGECRHSSIGFMRYLAVGQPNGHQQRLQRYIAILRRRRDGKGRWKGFPFYYTLLALSEIGLQAAIDEIQYAVPACERSLKHAAKNERFAPRRQDIIQKAFAKLRDWKLTPQASQSSLEVWISPEALKSEKTEEYHVHSIS
ncbi:MAG: hypothetical protein ACFFGZ_14205 [Candidatus Thorarchaeota archaeon]